MEEVDAKVRRAEVRKADERVKEAEMRAEARVREAQMQAQAKILEAKKLVTVAHGAVEEARATQLVAVEEGRRAVSQSREALEQARNALRMRHVAEEQNREAQRRATEAEAGKAKYKKLAHDYREQLRALAYDPRFSINQGIRIKVLLRNMKQ